MSSPPPRQIFASMRRRGTTSRRRRTRYRGWIIVAVLISVLVLVALGFLIVSVNSQAAGG